MPWRGPRRWRSAYGDDVAGQVRAWAPGFAYEPGTLTLPVDFRRCRAHRCADAPDARGEDVWRSATGESRATVFTHVVDMRGRGGPLYLQYWLYYPDSTWMGGAYAVSRARVVRDTPVGLLAGKVAGHHEDDWESYQLKLMPDGRVFARASAHNGYAGRKRWPNLNELPGEPRLPRAGRGGVRIERRARTGAWTAQHRLDPGHARLARRPHPRRTAGRRTAHRVRWRRARPDRAAVPGRPRHVLRDRPAVAQAGLRGPRAHRHLRAHLLVSRGWLQPRRRACGSA